MSTALNFKSVLDIPMYRPAAPAIGSSVAGCCITYDGSNDSTRSQRLFFLRSASSLDYYDTANDEWCPLGNPGLAGTFGAGASCIFHSSQGPTGAIASGTTTSIVLTTALPAVVGKNQLANRGDGVGYRVRIIGNRVGGSGKVEERTIVGNTAGTTPTLYLDTALSFTPGSTDTYEILAGKIYMLGAGTTAAGIFKAYDIATNSYSGNLSTTNLPATINTDTAMVALAEAHVPNDKTPGQGFFGVITASASSATSITASGVVLPSALQADEYRNFQIRIVEDTTTPTAAGQRRRISTHTGGSTAVFTTAAWAVTPSSSAKFVIENDNDKILVRTSASTSIYTYNITANTWDTSTFSAGGSAPGAGVIGEHAYGMNYDTRNVSRHSHVYFIRGGAYNTIDVLDIAGGANGVWDADIVYGNKGNQTFTTGTSGCYDFAANGGNTIHINVNATQRFAKFDMKNRIMDVGTYLRFPQGTAAVGGKMASSYLIDGATKVAFINVLTSYQTYMFTKIVQGN